MVGQRLGSSIGYMLLLAIAVAAPKSLARGVTPYLPLNVAPEIERQIERVLILADKPVMTRPIQAATVLDALPKACTKDAALCAQVRNYLQRYMKRAALVQASGELAVSSARSVTLPNQHGMSSNDHWNASAEALWQPSDYAIVSVGGVLYSGRATATGTLLSVGFEYAQLDIGYRDHWLSPMTDSAMLMGTEAPTMPSITLSNYAPIGALGVQYEVFLAEMSSSEHITWQGGLTSGHPRLAGAHIGIEPTSGWSLSANRVLQYGGGARPGSLHDLFNAFFNPSKYDNTSTSLNTDQESGNQQASWTSRFIFPGKTPFAVYFEYAGEDTSFSGNWRLGNSALSAGIHFPKLWHRFDLIYEISEWQNTWYVHHIYLDGMTNYGHVVGHWGGDQRVFNDGVGAQSQLLSVGWDRTSGDVVSIEYRTLANEHYGEFDYQRAHELGVRYSHPWNGNTIGIDAYGGRDVFGETFWRLGAFMRYSDAKMNLGSDEDTEEQTVDPGDARFIDLGASASQVRVNLGTGPDSVYYTQTRSSPHFGIGARRRVSDQSDLGVRLEADAVDGRWLLAVRALDYRYRFRNPLALSVFFGAARYHLATPAFGYYAGAGLQWRDLLPRWDLALDFRYGDKVARDKLLPQDPASTPRPDEFFDIFSAALYLSHRW